MVILKEFDLEKGESRRVPSLGRCIYCGEVGGELTDEHIIPFALGHNTTVFEKASCKACQQKIQPYEQRVLRSQLAVFRTRIGAPTRNKRDRPTNQILHFVEVDDNQNILRDLGNREFSIDDAPLTFSVWELPPPGILSGDTKSQGVSGKPWTYVDEIVVGKLTRQIAIETGSKNVAAKIGEINRNDFLRFLIKTAHAYAVYELGLAAFRPLTTDIVLSRGNELERFIGCDYQSSPYDGSPANMVEMVLGTVDEGPALGYTIVRIRLYPILGTPAHIIVVGAPL
jgi:HNH endonuclease